jgi:hypothetical protein
MNFIQSSSGRGSASVVATKINQGLFAFKNRRHTRFSSIGAISGEVCSIAASRQTHLKRAGRVTILLRPNEGEPF